MVFGGFSSKSLEERIIDVGAKLIITADEQVRGGKNIPLKKAVDEALTGEASKNVKDVIVYRRTGAEIEMSSRDVFLEEIVESEEDYCEPVYVEQSIHYLLYTSGSTGRPKGIQHSTEVIFCISIDNVLYI